jgi:phosphatidate phosphatase APP1
VWRLSIARCTAARNPFFYVSNSPRNLYAPLIEFLHASNCPRDRCCCVTMACA